jgi:hypothetical protein
MRVYGGGLSGKAVNPHPVGVRRPTSPSGRGKKKAAGVSADGLFDLRIETLTGVR